jgi:hypothetical protein
MPRYKPAWGAQIRLVGAKFAEVKPLNKDGNTLDFFFFLPISLLTSFSKVIEKRYCIKDYITIWNSKKYL